MNVTNETPILEEQTPGSAHNGARDSERKAKRDTSGDPLPGFNPRQLYEEGRWLPLIVLALIAVTLFSLVGWMINFNVVAVLLIAGGGWLVGRHYEEGRRNAASEARRNLMIGGGLVGLGALWLLDISLIGVLLLIGAAFLGWRTWQESQRVGLRTTEHRNRFIIAGVMGLFGLFHLVGFGPTMLLLIGLGVAYWLIQRRENENGLV